VIEDKKKQKNFGFEGKKKTFKLKRQTNTHTRSLKGHTVSHSHIRSIVWPTLTVSKKKSKSRKFPHFVTPCVTRRLCQRSRYLFISIFCLPFSYMWNSKRKNFLKGAHLLYIFLGEKFNNNNNKKKVRTKYLIIDSSSREAAKFRHRVVVLLFCVHDVILSSWHESKKGI
jgi:hypothetical protein